ncbi:hypothetical protein AVEN_33722-1 [Araneus ventricosus]|uniref:Uncharacterized protein n=1 Tax=Araneus ventricosus TaxID=182803 RepID=A0A4Y2LGK2_ARAVE|nr:hypothetical protein AVEN_33722-1 [Araneus ventricosus]
MVVSSSSQKHHSAIERRFHLLMATGRVQTLPTEQIALLNLNELTAMNRVLPRKNEANKNRASILPLLVHLPYWHTAASVTFGAASSFSTSGH